MYQKFKGLSRIKKIVVGLVAVCVLGAVSSAGSHPQTVQLNVQDSKSHVLGDSTTKAHVPTITTKTVTETQPIPFTSSTVQDASLPKGQTKVTTQGVDGVSTLTYQVTYRDGEQTDKKLVSQVTTTEPISQVTSIGTYVAPTPTPTCSNGTYVNSAGNTVCRPEVSVTVPAGATARCVDGTYSFSQSHSGTCSHHGGVAEWL